MTDLTERLGLPDTLTDEGLSHSLVSLIIAATQDPTPRLTLAQIYHAIACSESAHLLASYSHTLDSIVGSQLSSLCRTR
jgi:hypothetical protein